ncbi:MAG: hypothetical protein LBJ67_10940 [Planctomycetaceae bacterium]|jgi:hypothetical protein|nr:hypothetical protein [Planctomycetaceae bacterium]
MNYLLCLWPGAGGIVRYGRWSFLTIALLYGFVCCCVITVNFYWSEILIGTTRGISYFGLGVVWLILTGKAAWHEKICRKQRSQPAPKKDIFPESQTHYLQGNWFEAECCLHILLKNNPRDVEAILTLATLYRHKARYDEAANMLRTLELMEDAVTWKHEIRTEKRKLLALTSQRLTVSSDESRNSQTIKQSEEKYEETAQARAA